jgi:hypothetical protein
LSKIDAQPGFLNEAMDFLKEEEVVKKQTLKQCAPIFDIMALRKVVWDHSEGKFTANVDYRGLVDVGFDVAASEALFFQIISYSKRFKCLVSYCLTNQSDADIQSRLITCCLKLLFEVGIIVRSITSDETKTNIATYTKLGCKFFDDEMVYYFGHPCAPLNVYCMLDIAHTLKLARKCMCGKNIESTPGEISWDYIKKKKLDEIQEREQLRFGKSLTPNHIKIMKCASGFPSSKQWSSRCNKLP